MKILVDTSVWIDFFNGDDSKFVQTLSEFIRNGEEIGTCGLIISEFFQGLKSDKSYHKLLPYFEDMVYLKPREPDTYLDAAILFRKLKKQGISIRSTVDCLIACLASESDFLILSKDRDFSYICESSLCRAGAAPLFFHPD